MHPVSRHRHPRQALADGVLVLVVGEDQILATGVNVERQTEVLRSHGSALDVPPRPHVAPLGLVGDPPPELRQVRTTHQREIAGIVLLVVIQVDGGAAPDLGQVDAAELAIAGEAADVEVDGPPHLVRCARPGQRLRHFDHVVDVLGGTRVVIGREHPECGHVVIEFGGVVVGELVESLSPARRLADGLVIDVRQVDDVAYLIAVMLEHLLQDVYGEQTANQADVCQVVQGRTAGVDAHLALVEGPKVHLAPGQGVVEPDHPVTRRRGWWKDSARRSREVSPR